MDNFRDIVELRQLLHRNAELSGKEMKTFSILTDFLERQKPDKTYLNRGGNAILVEFSGKEAGKVTVIRADMDAVYVSSALDLPYQSHDKKVSHQCGHDGHMAVLAGFAKYLKKNKVKKGKIVLLFQPEEETGSGAKRVIRSGIFEEIKPDFIFGFHNLPGFQKNTIITRTGTFASASRGMKIEMRGKNAHAANPESGISPLFAVMTLIDFFEKLNKNKSHFNDFVMSTITHVNIGKPVFGISPGTARLYATLRSFNDEDMEKILEMVSKEIISLKVKHRLEIRTTFSDIFPATVNNPEAISIVKKAAKSTGLKTINQKDPFRWSEDFGHYATVAKTCYFGIGSGKNCAGLHHESYDFPDEIIPGSVEFIKELCIDHM